jgi:hypothetical protein
VFTQRDGEHEGAVVGVGDRNLDFDDAEHAGPVERCAEEVHSRRSATGDLDVGPAYPPPTRAEALHHRLLAGEPRGESSRRIGESRRVGPLVLGEAAFPKAIRMPAQQSTHAIHFSEIDPQSDDVHPRYSTVTLFARLRG